jgi:MoxR-like ATPase
MARGHILLEDVPGVGKTTLARAIAQAIGGSFNRVQFTSDMLPADILGVSVYDGQTQSFTFHAGPIFANVVLGDEINRTTPRTQSAMLEAMSEGTVTIEGEERPLPKSFLVLATQNPKEHHGAYPLPESQVDRFMICLTIGYPSPEVEAQILYNFGHADPVDQVPQVLDPKRLDAHQEAVSSIQVDETVSRDLLRVVTATRNHPDLIAGVSPRGSIGLYRAAQARAYLDGRTFVTPDDVRSLVVPCFAHRITARGGSGHGERTREETILLEILEQISVE